MSGPERRAFLIARRTRGLPARKLAKVAGVHVDTARRIIAAVEKERAA